MSIKTNTHWRRQEHIVVNAGVWNDESWGRKRDLQGWWIFGANDQKTNNGWSFGNIGFQAIKNQSKSKQSYNKTEK